MAKPIKHELLGYRTDEGRIVVWPERYASFKTPLYSRQQNPTPTQVFIQTNYFCILPIGNRGLEADMREELLVIIEDHKIETGATSEDAVADTKPIAAKKVAATPVKK